mgnify:CR=1 FL=1
MKKNMGYMFVVLVIVLAASYLGYQGFESRSIEADQLPEIKYVNFRVYDPVYVGVDRGLFEKHGVSVNIIGDVLAGPTAIQAVSAGEAQAGLSSIPAIINANLAGLPIQGVSDIQSALEGQPLEYYYTRCDSGIKTIEDLKGKDFAVNLWYSSFHYTAIMELEKAGMTEEDVNFILMSFPNQIPALIAGEVDVIGLMEPYNGMAAAQFADQICLLFDANDTFGNKQFTLHFVNRIWAENNPEEAAAFVAGIVEAIDWIENNQDEAKQIIAEYTEIPAEFVPEYHFQNNGMVIVEDVQFWYDYMTAASEADQWLDLESIATNQYNAAAE